MSRIVKKFRVPSRSEQGKFRHLVLLDTGQLFCDCPARMSKTKNCWHKQATKETIVKLYARMQNKS